MKKGIVLMTTVLILGVLLIGLGLIASQITSSGTGRLLASRILSEVTAFAHGCLDEGIYRIERDKNFAIGSLSQNGLSCTITVDSPSGTSSPPRIIHVQSNSQNEYFFNVRVTGSVTSQGQANNFTADTYSIE